MRFQAIERAEAKVSIPKPIKIHAGKKEQLSMAEKKSGGKFESTHRGINVKLWEL